MLELIIFIFGLIYGSFLNVVIFRLQEAETIVRGRSHCRECKNTLAWYDLVPIASFIMLGGKCRYCKKPISWQYPIVELGTALLLLFIWRLIASQNPAIIWQFTDMIFYGLIIGAMVVTFFYDLYHYIIPDEIIWPAIILTIIYQLTAAVLKNQEFTLSIQQIVLGGLIGMGVPALLALPSKGKWMGYGDIKLGALIGLLLGFPMAILGLFAAFVSGGVIGTGLLLAGKKKLKSMVPFGPFLVAGGLLALFCGAEIIKWYLGLFNIHY